MKTIRLLITLACTATYWHSAIAAPGDLDLTFNGAGKVITEFGGTGAHGRSVAVQTDGRIVLAGSFFLDTSGDYDVALARYNPDGSLDATFNGSGKVVTEFAFPSEATSVAIQDDGKIVVAGKTGSILALARYNTNGSLDTSFNGTGKVTAATVGAAAVAIQPDGKILVAGTGGSTNTRSDFALVRYNPNGSLDTSFNGGGIVTTDFAGDHDHGHGVALQNDGKIIVVGEASNAATSIDVALARYNPDGSLDTTFNVSGKVTTSFGTGGEVGECVAVQADGKIVVGGIGSGYAALVRYNADGSLDATFGSGGKLITLVGDYAAAKSIAIQPDGKIAVSGIVGMGGNNDSLLIRYNANGSLDATFHGTGFVTTDFGGTHDLGLSLAIQSNGKFVVAGYSYDTGTGASRFTLARYEGDLPDTDVDGIPDIYETGTGIYLSPTNTGTNPLNPDSDGDGLNDGREVNAYQSNPNVRDTDADGFDDGFEVATGFSPTSPASTPDAVSTILTAVEYRFNAANGISYRIEASTDLANWSTIETPIIGAGGVITRFYSIEGQAKRYFRSRRN